MRHIELGFDHPLANAPPMLSRIMTGIKRLSTHSTVPKLPITTALLREVQPLLNLQQRSDVLLWAMMWTATTGLLRISELAAVARSDSDTSRILRSQQLTLHNAGQRPLTPSSVSQHPRWTPSAQGWTIFSAASSAMEASPLVSVEEVRTGGNPLLAVAVVAVVVQAAVLSDISDGWELVSLPLLQWAGSLDGGD